MKRFLRLVSLAVAGLLAATAVIVLGAPAAHACSLEPSFPLSFNDLRGADPADPFADLQSEYDEWATRTYDGTVPDDVAADLPELRGVVLRQGLAAVDSADDSAASGGVTVAAGVWGDITGARWVSAEPMAFHIDTSSCSDIFRFPEPGEFRLAFADEEFFVDLTQPFSGSQIDDFVEVLNALFGDPEIPPRDADVEVRLFEEVIRAAEDEGVSAVFGPRVIATESEHLAGVTVPRRLSADELAATSTPVLTATAAPILLPEEAIGESEGVAFGQDGTEPSAGSGRWIGLGVLGLLAIGIVLERWLRRRAGPPGETTR